MVSKHTVSGDRVDRIYLSLKCSRLSQTNAACLCEEARDCNNLSYSIRGRSRYTCDVDL